MPSLNWPLREEMSLMWNIQSCVTRRHFSQQGTMYTMVVLHDYRTEKFLSPSDDQSWHKVVTLGRTHNVAAKNLDTLTWLPSKTHPFLLPSLPPVPPPQSWARGPRAGKHTPPSGIGYLFGEPSLGSATHYSHVWGDVSVKNCTTSRIKVLYLQLCGSCL